MQDPAPTYIVMFTILIHMFGISGVLFHGGYSIKIIPVLADNIVKDGHFDPKISN